jgi:hypothetical protein
VADEVAHVGAGVGGGVEDLVGGDAGVGIGGDVADRVAAALARGEPGPAQLADQLRRVGQRHVVELDVLPGGDVALAQGDPALDHLGEGLQLLGRDAAEGQLDADHLHVGLALPVDALLEAEGDEGVLALLAREEPRRFGAEVVELVGEDRDHVPGHVLVGLGVLPRSQRPLAALLLAVIDVESLEDRCGPAPGER